MALYLTASLLFASVVLSGLGVFVFPLEKKRIRLLLSFSGAYLFSLSLVHFLPEIYQHAGAKAGLFVLFGFLIQLVLEIISGGIEHGHIHVHKNNTKVPYSIIIGLGLHSFIEAMPLAFSAGEENLFSNTPLLLGIVLHKIPVAIVLVSLLLQSGISKQTSFLWLLIFAAIAPLGLGAGYLFGESLAHNIHHFTDLLMAVVVGIFLHVSTTILFEAGEGHRFNLVKMITVFLGAALAFLNM